MATQAQETRPVVQVTALELEYLARRVTGAAELLAKIGDVPAAVLTEDVRLLLSNALLHIAGALNALRDQAAPGQMGRTTRRKPAA